MDGFSRVQVLSKVDCAASIKGRAFNLSVNVVNCESVAIVSSKQVIIVALLGPEVENESVRAGERSIKCSGRMIHCVVSVHHLRFVRHYGVVWIKSRGT